MHSELKRTYDHAEADRKRILQFVETISYEKFIYKPRGKWSVSQILTHLITSERLSLQYMRKKSLGIDQVDNSGWQEALKSWLLKISQRLPLKYAAPEVLTEKGEPEVLPLEEIRLQWDTVRSDVRSFLEGIDNKNLFKKIYKHPVAGRLNVIQAIAFFREHVNHHLPQIKRLLR